MATEAQKFQVGLFVMVGTLLVVATLIWLGANRGSKKTKTYVTYFEEAVVGLDVESPVRFNGVGVGKVKGIHIVPDHNLVEVLMNIDSEFQVRDGTRTRLAMQGITGLKYIELETKRLKLDPPPVLDFAPMYPLIPSRRSDFEELTLAVEDIILAIKSIDMKGISDNAVKILSSANFLIEKFNHEIEKEQTLTKFTSFAEQGTILFANLNSTLSDVKLTLKEIDAAAQKASDLVSTVSETVKQNPSSLLLSGPPRKQGADR
mgnify:CR=1 FL=1